MEQWEPCCRYNFSEEDFRGERFKDFPHSLKETTIYYHITQPHAIKEVHAAYFEAGADIVETNTSQEPLSEWPITILRIFELNLNPQNCPRSSR
jgi:hypothetical protein